MDDDLYAWMRLRPIKRRDALSGASRHAARRDKTCTTPPEAGGNRRPGYDPEKRALGWAWTEGDTPPAINWIAETPSVDDAGNRLPVPQPCDYLGAYDHRVERSGAKLRKGSPLGFQVQIGVSPAWIAELGGLHDIDGPAWTERTVPLIQGGTDWGRQQFGPEAVVAARYDRDELGAGVLDLIVIPVHDSAPGTATQTHPIVSTNKELEQIGGGRGKGRLAFSMLQNSWAAYAQQHLDPRIQRGAPASETGRQYVPPAAYRRYMERMEKETAEKEAQLTRAKSQLRQARALMDGYVAWVQEWAEFVDDLGEQLAELDVRAMPARFPPELPGFDGDGNDDDESGPDQGA